METVGLSPEDIESDVVGGNEPAPPPSREAHDAAFIVFLRERDEVRATSTAFAFKTFVGVAL